MLWGSSWPGTASSAACWWSTGVETMNAPAIAAICGAQMPPATTTTSASILPESVWTAFTEPRSDSSMPVTRCCVRTEAPCLRAAAASACVAVCGSRWPSPGIQIAPCRERWVIAGTRRTRSSAEIRSTSSPMPRARLTPRCSSFSDSSLDAKRRLPTRSKTPSSSYSSMLYRRNRIMVADGLNCGARPSSGQVDPLVSSSFSTSTVSRQPAFARWYATLAPVMPPPMTTARARSMEGTLVRERSLLRLRQHQEQKRTGEGRDAAQLDRMAKSCGWRKQTHQLPPGDPARRGGRPAGRLGRRPGAGRKQLRGPGAEHRCGSTRERAPQHVADDEADSRGREAEARRERGGDRQHDGGPAPSVAVGQVAADQIARRAGDAGDGDQRADRHRRKGP